MIHNLILNLTPEQCAVTMQVLSDFIESQDENYSKEDVSDALNVMTQITNAINSANHIINENLE